MNIKELLSELLQFSKERECKKYSDCDTIQIFLKANHSIINH